MAGLNQLLNTINAVSDATRCPLTGQVMTDPVILVGTGYSFERSAIEAHLRDSGTDPMSHRPLTQEDRRLVRNPARLAVIQRWLPRMINRAAAATPGGPVGGGESNGQIQ